VLHAERWSGKEIAAQNVKQLKNSNFSLKKKLAKTFESWRFMSSTMARWKVLER
jgi:hypothetical protein